MTVYEGNEKDKMFIYIYTYTPEERIGYPLQYSCLDNSMDRGAWWATGIGVAKSQPQQIDSRLP